MAIRKMRCKHSNPLCDDCLAILNQEYSGGTEEDAIDHKAAYQLAYKALRPYNVKMAIVDSQTADIEFLLAEARKDQIMLDFLSLIDLPPNFEEQDLIQWRLEQLAALGGKSDG